MQANKNHLPSLFILVVLGVSVLFFMLVAVSTGIISLIDLFRGGVDPAGQMIGAFAFGFEALILLVCSWFVLQKTMGRGEQADEPLIFPFANWQILLIIGIVFFAVLIGAAAAFTEIAWLGWIILPILTVLVILPPLWLLFGLSTKGIELGERWRVFGIFGLSMTIGPLVMILLEVFFLLVIIIFGSIIVAIQNPEMIQEIIRMGQSLENESNPDVILNAVAPYLRNPVVIATIIGYIGLIVPLIEELLKPLAVWIFAKNLTSPAQGFAMGVLSGAAFALLESLNASADGTVSWPVIVSVRAGTSLLHMMASGLVGWGIASAFGEKRILRFFAVYFTAVAIHGIWNACAAGTGISALGESIGRPDWLFNYAPALVCGMMVLGIGMFAVLLASNRKLRSNTASQVYKIEEEIK